MKKKYLLLGILGCIVLVLICSIPFKSKTLKCTRDAELLKGFDASESLVVKINKGKIKDIKLKKEIQVSDFYDSYGTYYDSLQDILNQGYGYLDADYFLQKVGKKMVVNIETNKKGIVLNNLSIRYNSEDDETTLRYDAILDLEDKSAISVGDEISKSELNKKLKSFDYKCK